MKNALSEFLYAFVTTDPFLMEFKTGFASKDVNETLFQQISNSKGENVHWLRSKGRAQIYTRMYSNKWKRI